MTGSGAVMNQVLSIRQYNFSIGWSWVRLHYCHPLLFLAYFTIGRGNTKKTFVFSSSILYESHLSSAHPIRGVRMRIPAVGWICVLANFLAPYSFSANSPELGRGELDASQNPAGIYCVLIYDCRDHCWWITLITVHLTTIFAELIMSIQISMKKF
jgi:hypothetical protein